MNPSSRATRQKSGSLCASFTALILPVNSSMPARGCRSLLDEGVGLGEKLVLDANGCDPALLQLFHQPSHVVKIPVAGIAIEQDRNRVASLMNSTTSSTCVQLASLLSRTPSAAEIERPLAQMPESRFPQRCERSGRCAPPSETQAAWNAEAV